MTDFHPRPWPSRSAGFVQQEFEHQAAVRPTAVALIWKNDAPVTYGALNAASTRIARFLRRRGVDAGSRVAVCASRGPRLITALLGILKSGAAYVPIDSSYPARRRSFVVEDCCASLVLCDDRADVALTGLERTTGLPTVVTFEELGRRSASESDDRLESRLLASDTLCNVIYTSGSTGTPKGVAITHDALRSLFHAMQSTLRISDRDRWLAVTTISFDISALEWLLPLTVGAAVVLADKQDATDGRRLRERILQSDATAMQATPATWQMVLEAGALPPCLRHVLCGGEALSARIASALQAVDRTVWNLYGPTETTIWSTALRLCDQPYSERPGIGVPLDNTRVHVLDERLQPTRLGVDGELYIAGQGLARGYLGRPSLTADRFVANPFDGPGTRMYRTGDIVRQSPDGSLMFVGRADRQVKIRGHRIELGDVEAALGRLDTVAEAAVLSTKDKSDNNRLIAFVVSNGPRMSFAEFTDRLASVLPEHMIPSMLVAIDRLPLTPNGKIDRQALHASLDLSIGGQGDVSALTQTEQLLCRLWAEILGTGPIAVEDNFFEKGGHSLFATRVLLRVEEELGAELTLLDLFDNPTVGAFARIVDDAVGQAGPRAAASL